MIPQNNYAISQKIRLASQISGGVIFCIGIVGLVFIQDSIVVGWCLGFMMLLAGFIGGLHFFRPYERLLQLYKEELEAQSKELIEQTERATAMDEEMKQTFEEVLATQEELAKSAVEQTERATAMDEEMKQTFEEVLATQEQLAKSEIELRGRMEAINRTLHVCELNVRGEITIANDSMMALLGYDDGLLIGKKYQELVDNNFIESPLHQLVQISLQNKIGYTGEFKIKGKHTEIWFNASITPLFSESKKLEKIIILANDITTQKLKNIEYEARIDAISKFNAVVEFDLAGKCLQANSIFLDLLGYTEEQAIGKYHTDFIVPEEIKTMQIVWRSLHRGHHIAGDFENKTRNNKVIWLSGSYTPVNDLDGKPFKIVFLATDISKRKKIETDIHETLLKLKEKEAQLTEAQEIAGLGNWEINFITKQSKWSAQMYQQYGRNINTPPPSPEENYFELLHPQDAHQVINTMHANSERQNIDFVQRIFRPDNEVRHLLIKAKPILDETNAMVIGYYGTSLDITELKKVEQELKNTNQKLAQLSLVASKTSNGVIITDKKGKILWVNEGFTRITGYTLEEIAGKKPGSVLQGEQTDQTHVQALRIGVASQQPFQTEILNYQKSGHPYWVELSITPIFDEHGQLHQYIAIESDITERKYYELEIQRKNEDILASIEYAKRIQEAMLPTHETMSKWLTDHFVLYMPKDIVSGDFYWFEVMGGKIFIIAVDCTGHGVPGAFMSMLGNEILHEIIGFRGIHTAHEIIENMHFQIRKALKQEENKNHEGMDMGVTIIDKQQNTLEFAGAGNDLLYIQDGIIQTLQGNRKGVGGYESDKQVAYDSLFLTLTPDTTIYMRSDGYTDQFGGEKGKKFMISRFRTLVATCYTLPMAKQATLFRKTIEDWRNETNYSQIDDIMLLGVKI